MKQNIFYNAIHAPIGAHSTFTLGCKGRKGGLGIELHKPADQNLCIGLETKTPGRYEALPFWEGSDEALRFDHMAAGKAKPSALTPFPDDAVRRVMTAGRDVWTAGDFRMEIVSPTMPAPNPATASLDEQKLAYCPAVIVELTVDNTDCDHARRAFFGFEPSDSDGMTIYESPSGVACGHSYGVFTDAPDVVCGRGFSGENILTDSDKHIENVDFGLGQTGLLIFSAPPRKVSKFRIAVVFFRKGIVTTGIECSYWYSRLFSSILDAADFALKNFDRLLEKAAETDRRFPVESLNPAQKFQFAHAFNSYYGSTQLLDRDGTPLWLVNEGEYRMMNTLDLVVDQVFFELLQNPWTVDNELDLFVSRYSYVDKVHAPGVEGEFEGGISFTHDMGCRNAFAKAGSSIYERHALTGCFSYMTQEQLMNWILTAAVYTKRTGDERWTGVLKQCLTSMINRDNPDPAKRDGVMSFDSSKTLPGGCEVTTYDSLDASLGQARANAYLAVKGFASYVALADVLPAEDAKLAFEQARRAAKTIVSAMRDGFVPALLDGTCDSKIIPVVEGLVYLHAMGRMDLLRTEFSDLFDVLKTHFETVMKPGVCLYPDGAWKLSSSADNSWLSKIYLNQFIAREILESKNPAVGESADIAHANWLLNPENLYWAWSDQMTSGVARGSKYYPRGVVSVLWLEETKR